MDLRIEVLNVLIVGNRDILKMGLEWFVNI